MPNFVSAVESNYRRGDIWERMRQDLRLLSQRSHPLPGELYRVEDLHLNVHILSQHCFLRFFY